MKKDIITVDHLPIIDGTFSEFGSGNGRKYRVDLLGEYLYKINQIKIVNNRNILINKLLEGDE